MRVEYIERTNKPRLAYVCTPPRGELGEALPTVIFCGGYRSDMEGTKATYFEKACRKRSQGYVRFDYSGHGSSAGAFEDGTIGSWLEDTLSVIDTVVEGDFIIVGSSMGGWIALLAALKRPAGLKGVIGLASAPDFTEELFEDRLDATGKQQLMEEGVVHIPNDYSDEPYIFTKDFYEEAKQHLLLGRVQNLDCPLKLFQGRQDQDVPWQVAAKIADMFGLADSDVTFIEDGDHRLSRLQDLMLIDQEICHMSGL